ncbi:MAG: hypothetical protein HDT28_09215 [Clostridiales bacterium]|nr:hypothetical protein [Clostridiales bacterium]
MFDFNKRKTIIAIIGLALSIAVIAICAGYNEEGTLNEISAIGVVSRAFLSFGIVLCASSLFLIFFDKRLSLMFFCLFFVYAVLIFFVNLAEADIAIVVLAFIVFGIGSVFCIASYKQRKEYLFGIKNESKRQKLVEQFQKAFEEDAEIKQKIAYGEKSIFLDGRNGKIYQVIKTEKGYYFHVVGSELLKLTFDKFIYDFDHYYSYANKNDFTVPYDDIDSVKAKINANSYIGYLPVFGTITIGLKSGKKKKYNLHNFMERELLEGFFDGIEIKEKKARADEDDDPSAIPENGLTVLHRLSIFSLVFGIFVSAFLSVYFFFNTTATDPYFTVICVLVTIEPIVVQLIFPNYVTLNDFGKGAPIQRGKISYLLPAFLYPMIFASKCLIVGSNLLDCDYLSLFLYSLIPFVMLLGIYFIFGKEYRKNKWIIAYVAIAIAVFSACAVYKINLAFDFGEPQKVSCAVTDKRVSGSGDKTDYYLTIEYDGKSKDVSVAKKTYQLYEAGDSVVVMEYDGALGIEYAYLPENYE